MPQPSGLPAGRPAGGGQTPPRGEAQWRGRGAPPSRRRPPRRALPRLALASALPRLRGRWVREEDWAEAWKRHFHIERVGRRLVVSPRWREGHPRPGAIVIRLDPGMAFGTGRP